MTVEKSYETLVPRVSSLSKNFERDLVFHILHLMPNLNYLDSIGSAQFMVRRVERKIYRAKMRKNSQFLWV